MPERTRTSRQDRPSWTTTWSALTITTVILLLAAALLGGASRLHELRLAAVQLAALPLLVIALNAMTRGGPAPTRLAISLVAGVAALPLIQLIPLPPGLWQALPGRDQAALALDLSGVGPRWLPLTLTPDKTWRSFLALLPPVAIFLGVVLSPAAFRVRIVQALLLFTLASVLFGTAQVASGGAQLYLWPTTDPGNVAGFFANRNHLATLCLLNMPFAAVLGASSLRRGRKESRLVLWLSILFLALMIVALGVIRSRMGVVLLGPTLGASLLAAWVASGGGRPKPLFLGLVSGAIVAVAVVAVFALAPLLARFDTNGVREGRFENWPTVMEAANTYLPTGSGIGSFDPVYRSVEPLERLDATYFNQAHNDYLETWLETGWPGIALIVVFLFWFARRSWKAWRTPPSAGSDLHRAASVAIGVVLLHSFVDYPLRTETIAVVFAMCCGLLELVSRSSDAFSREATARTEQRLSRRFV